MSLFKNFSRELLHQPHHLSHQQIDIILGEDTSEDQFMEKADGLKMNWEFLLIMDAFAGAGIDIIPLKGPVLSYRLYSDPSVRSYVDLDFLVDESSMQKAAKLLESIGYQTYPIGWPSNKRLQRILANHDDQLSFYNPDKEITVELHWSLLKSLPVRKSKFRELVNSNTVKIIYEERNILVLAPEMELLYLVVHGGKHAWRRLKWIVDINACLSTFEIDWVKFKHLTKVLRAGRMCALCNSVLIKFFPGGPQLQIQEQCPVWVTKYSLNRILQEDDIEKSIISGFLKSILFNWSIFPGIRYKLNNIKNLLFVKEYFGENRILSSIPVFYFYGFSRFLIRRVKKKLSSL